MTLPTLEQIKQHSDELKKTLDTKTAFAVAGVSQTMFSIARHYGGCVIQGRHYAYNWEEDTLIRDDVVRWFVKREPKKEKSPKKQKPSKEIAERSKAPNVQSDLF